MNYEDSEQIWTFIQNTLKKRKWIILVCLIIVLAPVIYYNETAPKEYQASTMLVFEEFVNPVQSYEYDASREIMMTNRIEEIKSRSFARDVFQSLAEKQLKHWKSPTPLPNDFDRDEYVISKIHKAILAYPVRNSNILRLSVQVRDPEMCMILANQAAKVLQERSYKIRQEGVGGVRVFIEEQLERFSEQLEESERTLKNFKERNQITSIDKESQEILRRLTEAEVMYNTIKANRGSTEERLSVIQSNLSEQRQELVPTITNIASPWTQKLKQNLIDLEVQYMELSVQNYEPDHPKMVQLRQEIEKTKSNLAKEALKLSKDQNLVDPITQMEKYMTESLELQIELESIKAQEKALKETIEQYNAMLGALPQKEFELARLTRELEVNQKLYMILLERREEAKISEAEKLTDIRIIDQARLPEDPVIPRKKLNLALGGFLGLLLGFAFAFLLELKSQKQLTAQELKNLTKIPLLASIPKLETASEAGKKPGKKNPIPKDINVRKGLILDLEPRSAAAEGYRMLRTNLQFLGVGDNFRSLLLSSIGPGEGKSTTCSNLALAMAHMGKQVLLIDCDLRLSKLHTYFDIQREPGVGDYVEQTLNQVNGDTKLFNSFSIYEELGQLPQMNFSRHRYDSQDDSVAIETPKEISEKSAMIANAIENSIRQTDFPNLSIMTAGKTLDSPAEAMSSPAIRLLFKVLKEKYDLVIADTSPFMLVPETLMLSSMVDGTLWVVDQEQFDQELFLEAEEQLAKAKSNVIGMIFNRSRAATLYQKYSYYA
ncbi:AAA family ATPase [candidate division KSB1 bacterium]|nr:AAA family ATPase [candidate division KSB1 bacterium]